MSYLSLLLMYLLTYISRPTRHLWRLVLSAYDASTRVRFPGRATIPLGSNLGQVVY